MQYTSKLKLKKPDYTDVADIADINDNMDAIDKHTHIIENITGLQDQLNTLEDFITDKADGEHTHNINDIDELENSLNGKADKSEIPTALKNPYALTVKVGSTTATYDGSKAASVDINPSSVGAATLSHKHLASDITSGVLSVERGGTGQSSFDSTPTQGSIKMVTSGGVYEALNNTGLASSVHRLRVTIDNNTEIYGSFLIFKSVEFLSNNSDSASKYSLGDIVFITFMGTDSYPSDYSDYSVIIAKDLRLYLKGSVYKVSDLPNNEYTAKTYLGTVSNIGSGGLRDVYI